jgi:hypothetical protein
MAIIDLDSHFRDGWLLDEIYQLPEPFAKFSPKRIGDGKYFYSKFEGDVKIEYHTTKCTKATKFPSSSPHAEEERGGVCSALSRRDVRILGVLSELRGENS